MASYWGSASRWETTETMDSETSKILQYVVCKYIYCLCKRCLCCKYAHPQNAILHGHGGTNTLMNCNFGIQKDLKRLWFMWLLQVS